MTTQDLTGTIWSEVDRALAGVTARAERGVLDVIVHIPRDEVVRGLRALKRDAGLSFDYLRSLTAVDNEGEGIDVVYHLYSTTKKHNVTVKTTLPNDDLTVDTATSVWRGANWLERETAEKTSAVHFLRFELASPMVRVLKEGAALAMGVDHAEYRAVVDPVDAAVRDSLVRDLSVA